jgi:hypothetical protein
MKYLFCVSIPSEVILPTIDITIDIEISLPISTRKLPYIVILIVIYLLITLTYLPEVL